MASRPQAPDRPAAAGVLIAACVSALVVNANTSAVTILLPSISEDVGSPVTTLQWAVTGYSLVGAAVIVTSGALGDVLGRRKVFLAGLGLFIASCALIALSTSGAGEKKLQRDRRLSGARLSREQVEAVRRQATAEHFVEARRACAGERAGADGRGAIVEQGHPEPQRCGRRRANGRPFRRRPRSRRDR